MLVPHVCRQLGADETESEGQRDRDLCLPVAMLRQTSMFYGSP